MMHNDFEEHNVKLRTGLRPGDIGYIVMLHGQLYHREYKYDMAFESYVAGGLYEFYKHYDSTRDAVWILEAEDRIVGCLVLMHRDPEAAQLRYFLLLPQYRGKGWGKRLMQLFMEALREKGYSKAFLWTTKELDAAAYVYRRYGFVLVEEKESTAFGPATVEQRYEVRL